MVRGGRSWPSDWKAGAGAEMAGKTTLAVTRGSSTCSGDVANGVAWHPLAHRLQVSACPAAVSS